MFDVKRLSMLFLFLLFSNLIGAEPLKEEVFKYHGNVVSIINDERVCRVKIKHSKGVQIIPLKIDSPCHFIWSGKKIPLNFSYSDVSLKAVFIIAGNPIKNEDRKHWSLSEDKVCGTRGQGLLFDGRGFTTSSPSQGKFLLCRDLFVDEKHFYYFAHKK